MLEVHAITDAKPAEACDGKRLRNDIEADEAPDLSAARATVDDRQATAVDRDRRTRLGAMRPCANIHDESCRNRTSIDGGDPAESLYESCEHATTIPSRRISRPPRRRCA